MNANWQPIATAINIRAGTVADLKMESGRTYRAAWTWRGRCCAWWPLAGPRKRPIGLYEPAAWRQVDGVTATRQWRRRPPC